MVGLEEARLLRGRGRRLDRPRSEQLNGEDYFDQLALATRSCRTAAKRIQGFNARRSKKAWAEGRCENARKQGKVAMFRKKAAARKGGKKVITRPR